jgi:hypothetical protein
MAGFTGSDTGLFLPRFGNAFHLLSPGFHPLRLAEDPVGSVQVTVSRITVTANIIPKSTTKIKA